MNIYDFNGNEYVPSGGESKKTISMLFIGNSLTQDGIAYLPYMLTTYYPDIDFKFYMWYKGGYDLSQQYSSFISNGTAEIFSVAENNKTWTNYNNNKTMSWVLTNFTFDIVCIQEYFNKKTTYTSIDDFNHIRDYITSTYTGNNSLEFVTLFHAPARPNNTHGWDCDDVFELTKVGNALFLQDGVADDMLPNGIAVYRAMDTALDSLGDKQHLSPDAVHTQEGLPCLLQTFVTMAWLFDRFSIPKTIYNSKMRMTTAIYNTLAVPGANLGSGVIQGTDAQNLLAQEVAIKAFKEGKQFVMDNYHKESDDVKQALLSCFNNVAWTTSQGQDYYDALEEALGGTPTPTPTLSSISAVYTQSGTVYDTDTLDSLKTNLVVTATYSDGSTATVTSYTLSGTLSTGTSTITVTYQGKTATFTVTVTHATTTYSVTNTLSGCTSSNSATTVADSAIYSATITASSGYTLTGATVSVTMGGTDITSTAYSNGTISIASVTGNLVITVSAVAVTTYSIVNALTGCTSSNNATTAFEESSYSATITASTGYTLTNATVSVVMGETDITSTAYNNGTISIASVSGNITITIVAELNITPGVWYDLTPSMYTATRSDVTINSGGFIHQENVVTTSPETKYPEIILDNRITSIDFDIDNTGAYTWLIMAGTKDNYGAIALTQSSGGYPAQMTNGQIGKTSGLGGTKLNGCPYGNGHYTVTKDSSGITISKTGGASVTYTTANQPIYDYGDSSSWILGFCIQSSSPTGNGYKNIKVMFGSEVTE